MCEQFKTDFVEKIVQRLESDVINNLKKHYGIRVKPCIFKNEMKGCEQFCVLSESYGIEEGAMCKSCKGYVCDHCQGPKMNEDRCVICFVKDINFYDLRPVFCSECGSKNLQTCKKTGWFYCKECNTWLSDKSVFR
jgi:hypothetical protein